MKKNISKHVWIKCQKKNANNLKKLKVVNTHDFKCMRDFIDIAYSGVSHVFTFESK